jgi:hypothetical protein
MQVKMLQENGIRIAAMCCLTVAGAAWRGSVSIVQLDKSRDEDIQFDAGCL